MSPEISQRGRVWQLIPAVLVLSLAALASGEQTLVAAPPDEPALISLRVQTPRFELDRGGVRVAGYARHDVPGAPALPVWSTVVELPHIGRWEVTYKSVEARALDEQVVVPPAPVPPGAPLGPRGSFPGGELPAAVASVARADPAIYARDAFYPASPVVSGNVQWQRGRRLLALRVFPFQYNPASKTLRYHPDLRIAIRVAPGGPRPQDGPPDGAARPARLAHGRSALRLRTGARGFYRLTYDDLFAAGVPLTTADPATFAITFLDEPVDIQVTGAGDGRFDPGDLVIFYAEPYQGRYEDHNVYWFIEGGEPSPRMAVREVVQTGREPVVTQITQTLHVEFDREYRSLSLRPRDADHWFDAPLSVNASTPTATVTYTLDLDDLVPVGDVILRAAVHGGTDQDPTGDQSVAIRLNGHAAGTFQWEGATDFVATAAVPGAWFDSPSNQLTLEAALSQFPPEQGLSYYWISPDWVEVTYPAAAHAEGDRFFIEEAAQGAKELVVSGFSLESGGAVSVFDVRDPRHPVQLSPVQSERSGAEYVLHVWDTDRPAAAYFMTSVAALAPPLAIEPDTPSNWRAPDHAYDYIAIVHRTLSEAIQPLLDHRSAEGLRVARVDVQDIYDEFSGGRVDPEAIRSFLSYAYHRWNHGTAPPAYVLLVGDGHYDFTGVSGTRLPNLIPPYLMSVDPWLGETAADNRYVSVDGPDDYLPDMHIGRLPARDAADVIAVVDKIIAYETGAPGGSWQQRVVFVADDFDDEAGDFHSLSDEARVNWLPPAYDDRAIYYRRDAASGDEMRAAIKSAFDDGPLLLQWFGHASRFRWGSVSMFNIFDPPSLAANSRWPLTVTYACWSGYFINLANDRQSLAETLLLTPERGSIADLSPSGLHLGEALIFLNQGITAAIFQDRVERLGEAVDAGKLSFFATSSVWHDVIDTSILFGDPALRLRLPDMPRLKNSELRLSNAAPRPGASVTFTLALRNDGTAAADNVVASVDYDQARLTIAAAPGAVDNGDRLTWPGDSLPPGTVSHVFTAAVNPDLPPGTPIGTTAVIRATGQFDVRLSRRLAVAPPPTGTTTTLYLPLMMKSQ